MVSILSIVLMMAGSGFDDGWTIAKGKEMEMENGHSAPDWLGLSQPNPTQHLYIGSHASHSISPSLLHSPLFLPSNPESPSPAVLPRGRYMNQYLFNGFNGFTDGWE